MTNKGSFNSTISHRLVIYKMVQKPEKATANIGLGRPNFGDLVTPSEDLVTPSEDSVTPRKDSDTSSKDSVTPSKDSVVPSKELITPSKDSFNPTKEGIAPREDLFALGLPQEKICLPSETGRCVETRLIATVHTSGHYVIYSTFFSLCSLCLRGNFALEYH
jgi:hypothetical protein